MCFAVAKMNSNSVLVVIQLVAIVLGPLASIVSAAPMTGQIVPVAVYTDTPSAFGLAYDSVNNLIWFSQGGSGDALIHSLKPFKSFTAADLANPNVTTVGGVIRINTTGGPGTLDIAGTTNPAASFGAHSRALAFDAPSGQLVMPGIPAGTLNAFDPFTAGNLNSNFRPGSGIPGFPLIDGLDVDGPNVWYSPDALDIFLNGKLFANGPDILTPKNPDQTLEVSDGLLVPPALGEQGLGWAGVEQVGDAVFAVAVLVNENVGRSRTLVRFDLSGILVAFDPDGDPVAARWEDLAFDGQFLYAADTFGDANNNGTLGDIYVFGVTGGLQGPMAEPSTIVLFSIGILVLLGFARRPPSSATASRSMSVDPGRHEGRVFQAPAPSAPSQHNGGKIAVASCGVPRPSLADYVMGARPRRGQPLPEGASVDYPHLA